MCYGTSVPILPCRLGVRVESSNSWNKPRNTGAGGGGSRDRGSRGFSGRGGGRGRGGSAGGRGRTPRQQVSKEDLDAELEAYHNKVSHSYSVSSRNSGLPHTHARTQTYTYIHTAVFRIM